MAIVGLRASQPPRFSPRLTLGLGVALLAASPGAASATSARSRVGPAAGEVVTFTVTITQTDASDTTIGDGVCYVDLGPGSSGCTLRAALEEANKSAAPKVVVEFGAAAPGEISLAGPLRIERPLALLGPASGAVVIDGGGATRACWRSNCRLSPPRSPCASPT